MRIDRDNLRDLFQGYVDSKRPPCRKRCPSFSAIAGSFETSASIRDKKRIVDHISECSCCREEFAMLLELRRTEAGSIAEGNAASPHEHRCGIAQDRSSDHPLLWRYACIMIGLGLAFTSFFVLVQQNEVSEVQRTSETGVLLLSPEIDKAISGPLVFRWRGDPASEHYVLELYDEALLPVWVSDKIRGAQLLLPPEVYSRLQPGKTYYWMVTSYSEDSRRGESKLFRFMIVR